MQSDNSVYCPIDAIHTWYYLRSFPKKSDLTLFNCDAVIGQVQLEQDGHDSEVASKTIFSKVSGYGQQRSPYHQSPKYPALSENVWKGEP